MARRRHALHGLGDHIGCGSPILVRHPEAVRERTSGGADDVVRRNVVASCHRGERPRETDHPHAGAGRRTELHPRVLARRMEDVDRIASDASWRWMRSTSACALATSTGVATGCASCNRVRPRRP